MSSTPEFPTSISCSSFASSSTAFDQRPGGGNAFNGARTERGVERTSRQGRIRSGTSPEEVLSAPGSGRTLGSLLGSCDEGNSYHGGDVEMEMDVDEEENDDEGSTVHGHGHGHGLGHGNVQFPSARVGGEYLPVFFAGRGV